MPRVQRLTVTPKPKAWNKGRIIGQKRPLQPKQVWAIRTRLELAACLRGCDLVRLNVGDLVNANCVRQRVSVIQSKTRQPVQFELTKTHVSQLGLGSKSPR